MSHYPSWPPPLRVPLTVFPEHDCTYLPGRMARMRAFLAEQLPPNVLHDFMDAGFRRSGKMIYQPMCRACRECRPIRVLVERFHPSKSQRRCLRKNTDLKITIAPPIPTDEKFALYQHYMMQWHGSLRESRADFEQFLYDSPARTIEFSYRDGRGRLLAAGICDLCDRSLSSVYFYFDPSESRRGLGTFGALSEIFCARRRRIPYYYLGYWIAQCASMSYKSAFRPNQLLDSDGVWREIPCSSVAPADWHQAAAQ